MRDQSILGYIVFLLFSLFFFLRVVIFDGPNKEISCETASLWKCELWILYQIRVVFYERLKLQGFPCILRSYFVWIREHMSGVIELLDPQDLSDQGCFQLLLTVEESLLRDLFHLFLKQVIVIGFLMIEYTNAIFLVIVLLLLLIFIVHHRFLFQRVRYWGEH